MTKDNMKFYNMSRAVPENAKKIIGAGKIKGFTDINPMWRIQMLTEMFGPCGFGWYIDDVRYWTEEGKDGRVAAFCELNLYISTAGEWSKPIKGIGGSMFVNNFKGQPETSDEAYKMAYTDAISVACKALGIGADVYWEAGRTKYSLLEEKKPEQKPEQKQEQKPRKKEKSDLKCPNCEELLDAEIKTRAGYLPAGEFAEKFGGLCPSCVVAKSNAKQWTGSGDAK